MSSPPISVSVGIDQHRLDAMLERERAAWVVARPKARALHERACRSQLHGAPQHWVMQFPPPVPLVVDRAIGGRLYDTDDHVYADFGLGGTAALFGHSHPSVAAALRYQADRGLITTWPSEDQVWVTEELQRRFGLPYWQFTVSATDANRFALILARAATGRRRILVFNRSYHGSLEQTFAISADGQVAPTPGTEGTGVDVTDTTRVVEFNDLDGLERALAPRDVAAVITEPAMTCGGSIVLPEPGFHAGLREITRRTGTLLLIDETQTIPAGPGGGTRKFGLEPDFITMGKCLAGGVPVGLYGMSDQVAHAAARYTQSGDGGIGSTLAGGALTVRAMRAVLEEVMTEQSYAKMFRLACRYEEGVAATIAAHALPWHVVRLGARVAYAFLSRRARNASELSQHRNGAVREALWLYLANRGIVINGLSGSAQFSPLTDEADVDLHNMLFAETIDALAER